MAGYGLIGLEEIEAFDDGDRKCRQVRHHFGITAFGVNAWTADSGELINEHQEADGQEELYIILSGQAAFVIDGERRDAPAGTLVYVKPGVTRSATAQAAGTTVLVVGAQPGEPFEVSGSELFQPAWPLYQAGDYLAAIDIARPLAEANPSYPLLWYNLACCESLAGQHGEALEHLRRALDTPLRMSDRLRKLAGEDSDLDPVRGEPGFAELLGS